MDHIEDNCDKAIDLCLMLVAQHKAESVCFVGNACVMWERMAEREVKIDLGSDQTSCHNPWSGGYYPADVDFDKAEAMIKDDPEVFKVGVLAKVCIDHAPESHYLLSAVPPQH